MISSSFALISAEISFSRSCRDSVFALISVVNCLSRITHESITPLIALNGIRMTQVIFTALLLAILTAFTAIPDDISSAINALNVFRRAVPVMLAVPLSVFEVYLRVFDAAATAAESVLTAFLTDNAADETEPDNIFFAAFAAEDSTGTPADAVLPVFFVKDAAKAVFAVSVFNVSRTISPDMTGREAVNSFVYSCGVPPSV